MERKRFKADKKNKKRKGSNNDTNGKCATPQHKPNGQFAKGNTLSKGGNPYVAEQIRVREAIRRAMPDDELEEFVANWKRKARAGKGVYMLSLLDRWLGKIVPYEINERLSKLEELAQAQMRCGEAIKGPINDLL